MNIKYVIIILIIAMPIELSNSIKDTKAKRILHTARTTTPTNASRVYSPLTLDHEWPPMGRLLLTLVSAVLGTLLNGFFVASFCCKNSLSKVGNVFLACIGLTDIIITGGVLPVPALLIISRQWETTWLCYIVQFLTEASTYCYSLFFMLVSIETYFRLCRSLSSYIKLISCPIGSISFLIFVIGFCMAGIGVYLGLDYDYCLRINTGSLNFRVTMTVIFHVIPLVITIECFTAASRSVTRRASQQIHYRRSQTYEHDVSTTNLNVAMFIFFVSMWIPHIVAAFFFLHTSDRVYYYCAWIGVSRSVFSSFLYSTMHRDFRDAFGHLYSYCCCKNNIPSPLRNHHHRSVNSSRSTGDVRLHMMLNAPGRSERRASSSMESHEF